MQTDRKSIEIQGRGMECQQTIANLSGPTCNVLPGTSAAQHNHKWCNTIQYIHAVYVCVDWWVVRGCRVQEGGRSEGVSVRTHTRQHPSGVVAVAARCRPCCEPWVVVDRPFHDAPWGASTQTHFQAGHASHQHQRRHHCMHARMCGCLCVRVCVCLRACVHNAQWCNCVCVCVCVYVRARVQCTAVW